MRPSPWLPAALALLPGLLAPGPGLARGPAPVAVLEVHTEGLSPDLAPPQRLTVRLERLLAREGFEVVPRARVKAVMRLLRLQEQGGSLADVADQDGLLQLAREVVTWRVLETRILRRGARCEVQMVLHDMEERASSPDARVEGECGRDSIAASVERACRATLAGVAPREADLDEVQEVPPGTLPDPAADVSPVQEIERAYAAILEEDFQAAQARGGSAASQLEGWMQFLSAYPARNPYRLAVLRKLSALEVQAREEAARAARRAGAGPPGELHILVSPWAHVSVDGKPVGPTPLEPLELPPGKHQVTMDNPELGLLSQRRVEVRSGERTVLRVHLR
ncbi:MAG TPA: PEGA domain-containing protein [Myxococcota bacterium]|nr:PEGA domain-containing protein [Myxococcota bacterium]HRY93707.1 PEGA domain-containing protein [Myxococcota bacterium]HSA20625.1 PEGA domain-containing protein [Myxococcota bacterium]